MLETATALVLAHVLADFTMQSNAMVRDKAKTSVLLGHVGIVALVSWVALGLALVPLLLLLIAVTHFVIDMIKIRLGDPRLGPFVADQLAHLAVIALGAALFPGAWGAGLWGVLATGPLAEGVAHLPQAMAFVAGLVATVWAGGYAVRALMTDLRLPSDAGESGSLPLGGQLIGRLERLMILMLLLANQPDGIGLLIAAKSILRFNELAHDAASADSGRRASEYVIIGTLASFAWAIATAWVTGAALRALAP